jgi:uncharacterized protein YegL
MNNILPSYPDGPWQRTPCMLVLDASGSMATQVRGRSSSRIEELNRGLQLLKQDLLADETASMRVQVAIICVGGPSHNAELIVDWVDAARFDPPVLRADGPTPLAQGMRLALHHVDKQKARLNQRGIPYTRPWIMVMSDGEPTDGEEVWLAVADECRAAERAKRCTIFPISVEDGNLQKLQQVSSNPAARLSSTRFNEYFLWLSASLGCVSNSRPGESVALPATSPWAFFPR